MPKLPLTIDQILNWADDYRARTGRLPNREGGAAGPDGETWRNIDAALKKGSRGLPAGSSLALLLRDRRGRGHKGHRPPLTVAKILAWADAHHRRTGEWPRQITGRVADALGESWTAIDAALRLGNRTLPGGSSLANLLDAHRGVRNCKAAADLTVDEILAWADAHHARTGMWPTPRTGGVLHAPGETWSGVASALFRGRRGLSGRVTLARLLADERGARHQNDLPPITHDQILAWADAHLARTGKWPNAEAGPIDGVPHTTWAVVNDALYSGNRGLPGGETLARLLAARRGIRNPAALPPFSVDAVRAWVRAHHARTGAWPTRKSGPIHEAPEETWGRLRQAFQKGQRGLPKGSLSQLVAECRNTAGV